MGCGCKKKKKESNGTPTPDRSSKEMQALIRQKIREQIQKGRPTPKTTR